MQDTLAFLLEPDPLLLAQYRGAFTVEAHLQPEKRLMLAVLEDGIVGFRKHISAQDRRRKRQFREAEEWIMEETRDGLFSYESICEVLGFDHQAIRNELLRWKARELGKLRGEA